MALEIEELIRGINNKDMKAWEKLYSSYYSALCSYVNNLTKIDNCADDIVQEVLIKVWKSDKKFYSPKELSSYLFKAVYNNSLVFLRNNKIKARILEDIKHDWETLSEDAFSITIREEIIRYLYVHIDKLPEDRRKVIELTIKGLSGPEIAEQLGVSLSTVKTQKYRAFKYLRTHLKDSILIFLI